MAGNEESREKGKGQRGEQCLAPWDLDAGTRSWGVGGDRFLLLFSLGAIAAQGDAHKQQRRVRERSGAKAERTRDSRGRRGKWGRSGQMCTEAIMPRGGVTTVDTGASLWMHATTVSLSRRQPGRLRGTSDAQAHVSAEPSVYRKEGTGRQWEAWALACSSPVENGISSCHSVGGERSRNRVLR